MIDKNLNFEFNHKDQVDKLYKSMTADEIKQNFDSRGENIRDYIYGLIDALAAIDGAKNIGFENSTVYLKLTELIKGLNDNVISAEDANKKVDELLARYNDQVINAGNSNAEVVDARGSDANLKARLDKSDSQLADITQQKADKNTTYTKTDVYNKPETDSKVWNMANMGQDVKTAMTGGSVAVIGKNTVLTETVVDRQIIPIKTNFFIADKNIFATNWESGKIDGGTGVESVNVSFARTGFINVIPEQTYTITFTGITSIYKYIYYYTGATIQSYVGFGQDTKTITIPTNVDRIRLGTYKEGALGVGLIPSTTQIEKGTVSSTYEPFGKFDVSFIKDKSMSIDKLEISTVGKNKIKEVWEKGGYSSGLPNTSDYSARIPNFAEVISNTQYTLSCENPNSVYIYVNYYDSNYSFLSYEGFNTSSSKVVVTPTSCKYIRLSTYKANVTDLNLLKLNKVQLEIGSTPTTYSAYKIVINNDFLEKESFDSDVLNDLTHWQNSYIKAVAHRGYSTIAPENTIHAYTLAKEKGFKYVEADIQITSDNNFVLFHDVTIDSKSNGTGAISSKTLAELKALDFGAWKGIQYANTKILTLEEFILVCKKLHLHPYLEIKTLNITNEQAERMVNICKKLGMLRNVTWIGGWNDLDKIRLYDSKANIGGLYSVMLTDEQIQFVASKITEEGNAFIDIEYSVITQALSDKCTELNVGLECWIVNASSDVVNLSNYNVRGITTDNLNIAKVLKDSVY